jgi:DNA-binding MarR family transcriptional regulator
MTISHYSAATYKVRTSIGYLVRRASNLMAPRIEATFARHEITFVQWLVLMHLRDGLARTSAEICRELCHDSGALTRVLDALSDRGFIERRRSTEDRRVVELYLTDDGRRTVESLIPSVVGCLNSALEVFSADEVQTLTRLLTKLVDSLPALPKAVETSQLEFSK